MYKKKINYANISKITNIVKSDILKVELIDNFLFIQSGKSKIKLQVSPYEDIPELPISNISNSDFNTNNLSIDREIFINIIKSVSFAVANTDIKPEISSVYMYNSDSYLIKSLGIWRYSREVSRNKWNAISRELIRYAFDNTMRRINSFGVLSRTTPAR